MDFNDSSKIDCLSEISDYESLDNILGEFYTIQKLMNEQYISKDMVFLIHLVIQQQEFHHMIFYDKNLSHFVKKMCDSIFSSFMPFVHCNLSDDEQELKADLYQRWLERIIWCRNERVLNWSFLLVFTNVNKYFTTKSWFVNSLKISLSTAVKQEKPEVTIN